MASRKVNQGEFHTARRKERAGLKNCPCLRLGPLLHTHVFVSVSQESLLLLLLLVGILRSGVKERLSLSKLNYVIF